MLRDVLKHTGPLVHCRDTTNNFSVDEQSRECNVQVNNNGAVPLGYELLVSRILYPGTFIDARG